MRKTCLIYYFIPWSNLSGHKSGEEKADRSMA